MTDWNDSITDEPPKPADLDDWITHLELATMTAERTILEPGQLLDLIEQLALLIDHELSDGQKFVISELRQRLDELSKQTTPAGRN